MEIEEVSKLYEVIWSDPAGNEMDIRDLHSISEDPDIPLNKFLVNTHSYGSILCEDEGAVILGHYVDGNAHTKFKTIPKSLIQEIIPYRRNNRVNLKRYYTNERTPSRRRLVEVSWLAPDDRKMTLQEINKAHAEFFGNLLLPTLSYGTVAIEDPDALLLKYYENDIKEREIQIIPQALVKKITPFYSKRS